MKVSDVARRDVIGVRLVLVSTGAQRRQDSAERLESPRLVDVHPPVVTPL
jgi:hypothetical protein